jgi:hypothetical protein
MARKSVAVEPDWIESGDAEFDEWEKNVWEALEKSGNAEGLTRIEARTIFAKRVTEFAGKDMSHLFANVKPRKSVAVDQVADEPVPPLPVLRIPTPRAGGMYWYEAPEQSDLFDHFIAARKALGAIFHGGLLLTGPAGSGKTLSIKRRLTALGQPFLVMNAATVTDPQKWFGRREIDKDGTRYEESAFVKAVRAGWVVVLDEFNRAHPAISNPIYSLLDGQQELVLSDLDMTIPVHPATVFIATANIGSQFGGTYKMDHAMRRRFPFTIEREFPPRDEEIKVLLSVAEEVTTEAATNLVDIAGETRRKYENGDLRFPIDTATLVGAAWLCASGYTERQALEVTALPLYEANADGQIGEKSERAVAMGIIEGALGRA